MKIDLGCGSKKRDGFIGVDFASGPGVDHIVNLESETLPFADDSVDHLFSSHCLEHLDSPNQVWREVSRVVKPGGLIEIWTPYPWHDDMTLIGHVRPWSEAQWVHLTSQERAFYSPAFLNGGFWRWRSATFVVDNAIRSKLADLGLPIDFAIRHMINIVKEWGCEFEYVTDDPGKHDPERRVSSNRYDDYEILDY